jgi:hypothetical protein
LVSSSQQNCHTKLYRISNLWSHLFTKSVTQSCTDFQIFGLFYSPKLSHKTVQNIKTLVSSSQKTCHTKLYSLSNLSSLLVNKTVTQNCTEYQIFGLFQSPKLSHNAVQNIKSLVSSSHQTFTQSCTEYQMFGLFHSTKQSHKAVQIIKCFVSSSQQNCRTKLYRLSNVGLFQSPNLSHKAVKNIKCLVSSSHQTCHTKLYRFSNLWSLPITKIVTQSCTEYQTFGLF